MLKTKSVGSSLHKPPMELFFSAQLSSKWKFQNWKSFCYLVSDVVLFYGGVSLRGGNVDGITTGIIAGFFNRGDQAAIKGSYRWVCFFKDMAKGIHFKVDGLSSWICGFYFEVIMVVFRGCDVVGTFFLVNFGFNKTVC